MKIHLATGRALNIEEGESVIETLKRAEIFLSASCGGKGTCSKCKIKLKSGRARIISSGKLTKAETGHGIALACQTFPDEDIHIEIPDESRLVVGDQIALGRSRELFPTLGAVVAFYLAGHVMNHLGQLSAWRRCIGLPPAA